MPRSKARVFKERPKFLKIPPKSLASISAKGVRIVRWGLDVWLPLALHLRAYLDGPEGTLPAAALARMVFDLQAKLGIPEQFHRGYEVLVVSAMPSAKYGRLVLVLKRVLDEYDHPAAPEPVKSKPPLRVVKKKAIEADAATPTEPKEPAPAKAKPLPQPPPEHMPTKTAIDPHAALMAMPVGAFLPLIKEWATDALVKAVQAALAPLLPQLEGIVPAVRQAVEDVIGAPTLTPETVALPVVDTMTDTVEVQAAQETTTVLAKMQEPEPHKPVPVAPEAPHDLATQMAHAAKALGIQAPAIKRPSIVVCGLHPKVMAELEHTHGRHYRFTYIKQDHFNAAADLPPSTDALILCRKKLSHELMCAVRRYSIPMKAVPNSVEAAQWALRDLALIEG